MHIARSFLLLLIGAVSGVSSVLSCGDNLSLKANADAAVDAPKPPDATPICDCPPAERPLAGRFLTISNTFTIPSGVFSGQSAYCPAGSQLILGSCTQDEINPIPRLTLEQSGFFEASPTEWWCFFRNNDSSPITLRVSVICLTP